MGTIQYRVLKFTVMNRGEIVKQQIKLPTNLKVCTGYLAKVSDGITNPNDYPQMGFLTLEFNSKKELLVNDAVGYECEVDSKPEFQTLDVELNNGELLSLLYLDKFPTELQFAPYSVRVYLRCSTLLNCKTHV